MGRIMIGMGKKENRGRWGINDESQKREMIEK